MTDHWVALEMDVIDETQARFSDWQFLVPTLLALFKGRRKCLSL